jgi:methionyl-tRNA synthetase
MPEHILVAVAWPYANGPRHVGHVAGFGVPSDIFARYQRLKGNHVLMVSGTDEHGTPITLAADKEGVTPKQLADRYNRVIGDDLRNLGLSYDLFTRTTTANHYRVVQDVFQTLYNKGYLETISFRGLGGQGHLLLRQVQLRIPAAKGLG